MAPAFYSAHRTDQQREKTYRSPGNVLKLGQKWVFIWGPLRLLALEVYEQMKKYKVPCTMRTGQECHGGRRKPCYGIYHRNWRI